MAGEGGAKKNKIQWRSGRRAAAAGRRSRSLLGGQRCTEGGISKACTRVLVLLASGARKLGGGGGDDGDIGGRGKGANSNERGGRLIDRRGQWSGAAG